MDNVATFLKPGSSPVDWCEDNYQQSRFIAEFANTFSNVVFFTLPPLLIRLFGPYGRSYNRGIHIIWTMLMVVGICSAYFHATLSLFGQLLDELAILWVVATAFALWFPERLLPFYLQRNRPMFQMMVLAIAVVSSGLAFLQPAVNAFALMTLGVPAVVLLVSEVKRCHNSRVVRLGARCAVMWILALTCWINDRLFCDTWSKLNFPYLHAVWHVLIFIAAYTGCVLFAYFDAKNMVPEKYPEIKYWPTDRIEFLGIPFVSVIQEVHGLSGLNNIGIEALNFKPHLI